MLSPLYIYFESEQDIVNKKNALKTTDTPLEDSGTLWSTNKKLLTVVLTHPTQKFRQRLSRSGTYVAIQVIYYLLNTIIIIIFGPLAQSRRLEDIISK